MEIKSKMQDLYENTEKTIQEIADELGITYKVVWSFTKKNYSKEYRTKRKAKNYSRSKTGVNNPHLGKRSVNYKGDCSDGKGYLTVCKPPWYSRRPRYSRVFKHHVVVCENIGLSAIPEGYCVHHIDGDKLNNSINNLALMTQSAHTRLHCILRGTVQRLDTQHTKGCEGKVRSSQ